MDNTLRLKIDRLEGTVLRILGLVERRGFHLQEIKLTAIDEDHRGLDIVVLPRDPSRSLKTLGLSNRQALWRDAPHRAAG